MKRIIFAIGILFLAGAADAQTKNKTTTSDKKASATVNNKITKTASANAKYGEVFTLSNTNSYSAFSNNSNRLQIWDPTVKALDAKAKGANITISESGIVGMPKRAYGFANGQLLLRSTDAVSSGTITGSGAVGTGTSPGAMGRMAQAIGVNGKNPYAGIGMGHKCNIDWSKGQRCGCKNHA